MKLDQVTAAIRPRSPYEAIDLGFAMARDAVVPMWKCWFAATLPLFIACNGFAHWLGLQWLAGWMMWWLKPMFDRVLLYVLSRRLFGETPGVGATLRALPGLWLRALPGGLLMERLDLARSLDLPVAQLEGLRWFAHGRRLRILHRTARAPAVMLTITSLGFELALMLSLWVLVLMFVPFEYLPESARAMWAAFVTHATPLYQVLVNLAWYLATSCIEPFYVAAGFSLYLSRRTELEAWDIEIAFRRMAERLQEKRGALAAALVLALVWALHPAPAQATTAPAAITRQAPVQALALPEDLPADAEKRFDGSVDAAYRDPDLSPHEKSGHWEWRGTPSQSVNPGWLDKLHLPSWLQGGAGFFSGLGKAIAWLISHLPWVIGLALLALAVRYRRWLLGWLSLPATLPTRAPAAAPELVPEQEPLPPDVAAAALALWQGGARREALALLYRGSLQRVQELGGRELPQGATEADCLRAAAGLAPAPSQAVGAVVRAWQQAAYAHRLPEAREFGGLVEAWRAALGAAA